MNLAVWCGGNQPGLFVIDEVFIAGRARARPHLDLDTTPEPARMLNINARNGMALPDASVEALDGAGSSCSLRDRYSAAARVLPSPGLDRES